jgi:hypothetical protein
MTCLVVFVTFTGVYSYDFEASSNHWKGRYNAIDIDHQLHTPEGESFLLFDSEVLHKKWFIFKRMWWHSINLLFESKYKGEQYYSLSVSMEFYYNNYFLFW